MLYLALNIVQLKFLISFFNCNIEKNLTKHYLK